MGEHYFDVKDEEDFKQRVVEPSKTAPIIVDFFATWCGPCKQLDPRIKAAVGEHGGKILLAKVDVDELQEVAMEYGIEALPTVCCFFGGKIVDKFVGGADEAKIKAFVEKSLNTK